MGGIRGTRSSQICSPTHSPQTTHTWEGQHPHMPPMDKGLVVYLLQNLTRYPTSYYRVPTTGQIWAAPPPKKTHLYLGGGSHAVRPPHPLLPTAGSLRSGNMKGRGSGSQVCFSLPLLGLQRSIDRKERAVAAESI